MKTIEDLLGETTQAPSPVKNRCVVRLTTSAWHDEDGAYLKKTLRYLKRQCVEYNILDDECDMIGSLDCMNRIVNLYDVEDGVYEVLICNPSTDWESGIVDDYDLTLAPFTP